MNSGCSLHNAQLMEITDTTLKDDINNSIVGLYPDRFKAIHRVILTLAGKDYVLNGYLFVDRPKREIKLIAQNDLGGILFDVHFIENVEKKILINVNTIKKDWIEKSVLRDIKMLYLKKPFPSPALFSDQHQHLIVSEKDGQITEALIYKPVNKPGQYRLIEIRHLKNGRCIYTVNFKYGTGDSVLYPEIIIIKDTEMRYDLQINVQYFM